MLRVEEGRTFDERSGESQRPFGRGQLPERRSMCRDANALLRGALLALDRESLVIQTGNRIKIVFFESLAMIGIE